MKIHCLRADIRRPPSSTRDTGTYYLRNLLLLAMDQEFRIVLNIGYARILLSHSLLFVFLFDSYHKL